MIHLKSFSKYFIPLLIIPLTALALSATTIVPPVITVEPRDTTVFDTSAWYFSVTATGDSLKYTWYRGDTLSSQKTNYNTFKVRSMLDSGLIFKCIVSNSAGADTSVGAMLHVLITPPLITRQPANDSVYEGESGSFGVRVSGSRLTYQWQKAGVNCTDTNATKATYVTPPTSFADTGVAFRCIVSNSAGSDTSDGAFLFITKSPPTIVKQPVNDTVNIAETATFTISATSKYPPMTFQWQSRLATETAYTPITGATDSTYTTAAVVEADHNKRFQCLVTDSAGTRTSNSATLCILFAPPVITVDPVDLNAKVGDTATFKVSVTGSGLSFQWQQDTVNVMFNGRDSIYKRVVTLSDTLLRSYRCIVSNTGGKDTSAYAKLMVKVPPKIVASPKSDTVNIGETATFTISATSKYPPLSYQWQSRLATDSVYTNIATGGTDSSYTTPVVAEVNYLSRFRCVVTDSAGSATSQSATLYILFPTPVITTEPVGDTVNVGDTVSFKVTATGGGLSFQWQRDGVNIPMGGGRDSVYKKIAALTDSGVTFRCIVRNTGGADTSSGALLIVKSIVGILDNPIKIQKPHAVFSIGPNPATDAVTFKYLGKKSLEGSLMIYDAVGNLLYKKGNFRLIPNTRSFLQWNLNNQRGRKVGTGSYLAILLVKNTDGSVAAYGQNIGVRVRN